MEDHQQLKKQAMCAYEFANITRQMINHENELTNHRIQWFLIIQGFLITSVGVTYGNAKIQTGHMFVPVISLFDFLSCIPIFYALDAAGKAIRNLYNRFLFRFPTYSGPSVIGLRHQEWDRPYFRPGLFLPVLFMFFWLIIAWFPILT